MTTLANPKPERPFRLRRWHLHGTDRAIVFYTCARPGRSGNPSSRTASVTDKTVSAWVRGLPGSNVAIISLLGKKPDGMSEYSFYSFSGGLDRQTDQKPRFASWLRERHLDLEIELIEHPTTDFQPVPPTTISGVLTSLERLAARGKTVTIVDSGGETRTGAVCRAIGAKESFD